LPPPPAGFPQYDVVPGFIDPSARPLPPRPIRQNIYEQPGDPLIP
jgi:hypothetical protein